LNDLSNIGELPDMVSNMDSNIFILSIIFGIIGMGYFSYGKNQDYNIFFYTGIGLMIFTYFISDVNIVILVGIFLCLIPFLVRKIN